MSEQAMNLTADEICELDALDSINRVLRRDSFIARHHWREGYARLVRLGLVIWRDPPKGFSRRRFAGIRITAKGRRAIRYGAQ